MRLGKTLPLAAMLSLLASSCNRNDETTITPPVAEVKLEEAKPVEVAPVDRALAEINKINESYIVRPVNLSGINEIYLREIAQDKLRRIFGASVVMQELGDFYHYGYGSYPKAEGQTDEEYYARKAAYLKRILPGTFTTANQAKRLSEQATNDLYGTLTPVSLSIRTLQALKLDSDYRGHFAGIVKEYEMEDLSSLIESMDDVYKFLSEAGINIAPESKQSQDEILKLIIDYKENHYGGNLFSILQSDLFGYKQELTKGGDLIDFLSNEASELILDRKKNISVYWNAHTYLRAQTKMENDENYKAKLLKAAKKYGGSTEQIIEALALTMPLFVDENIYFGENHIYYDFLIEEDERDTSSELVRKKKFQALFEDFRKVSNMGDNFEQFFSEEAGPLLLATYSDEPDFLSAYFYHTRIQKELDGINGSVEWMAGRIPNETDMESHDVEELKKSLADAQDFAFIDAQNLNLLCRLIIREAIEASDSIYSMANPIPEESEYFKDEKPSEQQMIRKMEAKLQLNQLGFNMELLNSFSGGMADYYDLAKTPEANTQIKQWGEEIGNYNRYMLEATGNKPGDKDYSGPWEDEGVLPLAVKMAQKIGLSTYEIEFVLNEGRALAASLEPEHIGYSHPLDFRADGGSGVFVRP